ncbi:uncharacterized protein L201_001813 [Kwoniella dendrophila CBS 6074]|uniref:Uncharacterized protein n=1 Tax=Kwoniella dendrophila CBS 6074 TaxID=1295534 RepID=A0AAX4JPY8_9TREE
MDRIEYKGIASEKTFIGWQFILETYDPPTLLQGEPVDWGLGKYYKLASGKGIYINELYDASEPLLITRRDLCENWFHGLNATAFYAYVRDAVQKRFHSNGASEDSYKDIKAAWAKYRSFFLEIDRAMGILTKLEHSNSTPKFTKWREGFSTTADFLEGRYHLRINSTYEEIDVALVSALSVIDRVQREGYEKRFVNWSNSLEGAKVKPMPLPIWSKEMTFVKPESIEIEDTFAGPLDHKNDANNERSSENEIRPDNSIDVGSEPI